MLVALAQLRCPLLDPNATLDTTLGAIDTAAAAGARLIVLPELAASGYVLDEPGLRRVAESGDGGTVTSAWRAAARRHQMTVIGGRTELDGDSLFNAVVVISPSGEVVGHYRKLHLFGAEHRVFTPGDLGIPLFDVAGLRLGVLVCYDLRFPEALRIAALRGAQVIAVPTAWVGGFDRPDPGEARIGQVDGALVQANLSQVWVLCADHVGRSGTIEFLGRSVVVDPYGRAVLGPLSADEPGVHVVDIDPDEALRAQERGKGISPRRNRRTDVYDDLLGYRPPDRPA